MVEQAAAVEFQLVDCRVVRALPFGLLVSLPNGHSGIIRERELSWTPQERAKWRGRFTAGTALRAVILREAGNTLELSLRYAESDPWIDVHGKFKVGQLVTGTVTGVRKYGAFIEIDTGLSGLLHRSELPQWIDLPIEDVLWVGDRVNVLIESIEAQERRISLSMQHLHDYRWPTPPNAGVAAVVKPAVKPAPLANGRTREQLIEQLQSRLPQRVLVVDDDCAQRDALASLAAQAQQHVGIAESADDALPMLDTFWPDVVVMDVGMPGTDGIAAMNQIRRTHPHIRCVLMTDWSRAGERLAEIEKLAEDGVSLLVKPVLPEDLLEALFDQKRPIAVQPSLPLIDLKQATSGATALRNTLVVGLRAVRKAMQATLAILFSVDPAQQRVDIVAQDGALAIDERAIPELIFSPVRDLSLDGARPLIVSDVRMHLAKLRYLLPLATFGACAGTPVLVEGNVPHVLLCFYKSKTELSETHLDLLRFGAFGIGSTLIHYEYSRRIEESQRFTLLGHLTRALVHEVNHQIGPILYSVDDIRSQHAQVMQLLAQPGPQTNALLERCDMLIARLDKSVRTLATTTRVFGRVTVMGQSEVLRLDEIVREAYTLTRDMADRDHVVVEIREPERLLLVKAPAANILQAVLNVMINAIQQIALTRPMIGGHIHIYFATKQRSRDTVTQIIIEDDGPGIHKALTERIFELGFTTRRGEGSGQGLYVARRLLEALNGQLFLQETKPLWGSRFVIELPSSAFAPDIGERHTATEVIHDSRAHFG